ncbi:bromodomain-containing protein-like isoform X2 [Iris pallida]|uniref:Bromodomain-containing protein-like isoform X2 n=1 Tax=Iris pallida TaxID=29817 RepID=A0AAX6GK95_IRIPA|nr:bromodomain-containing protein-like isoform X2 [Iris pallida]
MGNSSEPSSAAERKKKKKGRPSLLDLQKRSLRLQNPNPSSPSLRTTRRNPNPDANLRSSSSDDGGSDGGRQKKKLKLVHRIPNSNGPASGSDKEEKNNPKVTDAIGGEPSDSGPTTPLPDKKLLVFILDRLQKKDTYGVFSEPVDPEELPDYNEIIEHPMDFATVREKLSSGSYASLEQFEKDVFLISSNAMCYNSQDTIYYRQARAIHELAKKNFENLRQESDGDETEPKTVVRRGRPPSKNIKPTVVRASVDRAASDFSSDATLANAGEGVHWSNLTNDLSRKGPASKKASAGDVSTRATYNLRKTGPYNSTGVHMSENNEDYPGTASKAMPTKYGKKLPVADENRRNTYYHPQPSSFGGEPSILTTFDSEKKHLMPQIGLQLEHAYARSLARFAANLGPIGWAIAAKKIERVLPPGTKYGRGWIGESEDPQHAQQPISSSAHAQTSSQPKIPLSTTIPQSSKRPERLESSSNDLATKGHSIRTIIPPVPTSFASNRSSTSMEVGSEPVEGLNHEGELNPTSSVYGLNNNTQFNSPFHLHQNAGLPPNENGHISAFGFSLPSHVGHNGRPVQSLGSFGSEAPMTHSRALDMVSRNIFNNNPSSIHQISKSHLEAEKGHIISSGTLSSGSIMPGQGLGKGFQGSWQSLSYQPKQDTIPPDLNARFQSPGSPAPGTVVEPQQPDLALQL